MFWLTLRMSIQDRSGSRASSALTANMRLGYIRPSVDVLTLTPGDDCLGTNRCNDEKSENTGRKVHVLFLSRMEY